ncbi:uncharacterized protein LOC130283182 [Hyla sarda]|uniref:uncharacterized protein LOC130283182 n=1 Tax=Hyla sarda TaxID=327740 RepID=UPI0024C2CBE2|nr:uncharacterized protein LOC130283182 [Hyla sarda]
MQNPENSTLTVNPQCSYKEVDTLPRSRSRCTTLSRASSQTNLTSVSADASRFKRHSSRHSSTTSLSSASAIATKARAKAEAACAMASYAKQEAELMKEQAEALRRKAEVQASLHLLHQQKNAAAALAEAEVLTRAAEAQFADIETQMPPLSASQRTREYIQSQAIMYTDQQFNYAPRPSLTPPAISNFDTMQHCKTESEPQGRKSSGRMLRDQSANLTRVQTDADLLPPQANTSLDYSRKTYNRGEQSRLSQVPHQPYQPQSYPEFTPRKYSPDAARATEVARFLMRREIVSAGLMKFDDRPENYWAWKSSFLSARSSCRAINTDQRSNGHREQTKVTIIRCIQQEVFKEEIQGLLKKEEISQHNSLKDLYTRQWKQVQSLADIFWKRWRQEYLVIFQPCKKWQDDKPNLQVGDVVLLKDSQAHRNEWPIGLIVGTDPSSDARVRKVEVRIVRQGIPKVYARPISEVVLLLSKG